MFNALGNFEFLRLPKALHEVMVNNRNQLESAVSVVTTFNL